MRKFTMGDLVMLPCGDIATIVAPSTDDVTIVVLPDATASSPEPLRKLCKVSALKSVSEYAR